MSYKIIPTISVTLLSNKSTNIYDSVEILVNCYEILFYAWVLLF